VCSSDLALVILLFTTTVLLAKVKFVDDPPVIPKPMPGSVTGTISPVEKIRTLTAVSRQTGNFFTPTSYDPETGAFTFKDLPGAASYDICITTNDSREIQGIDLSFVDEYLLKLADLRRQQLKLPQLSHNEKPFGQGDVDVILKFVESWEDFMDQHRVLYISGNGARATVLVELMRTREFHGAKNKGDESGDIIWRIELWYFTRSGGGWELIPNVERVLQRTRGKPGEWKKIDVTYYPELTARLDEQGKSPEIKFTIPEKSDSTRGRPPNTKPNLKTKPHIIGVTQGKSESAVLIKSD